MHVTVPLWMVTGSNTLVYCRGCVCLFSFAVLYCECIFLCDLSCLMFIDMFCIQMQLIQRLDQWNEHVCMYVCMYVCISPVYLLCTTNSVWVQVQECVHAHSIKVSLYHMHKWHYAIYTLFLFITSILVHVHICQWQGGILHNLYSGKVMCMFTVSILYVVYCVLVVDLLRRVESCVMYVRVGKIVTWLCIPDTVVW